MLEGQIVGTATQIDDNTTTSVLLDFSDDTLYAAIGVSIAGNDLANQIVLDGALGFGAYLSRLTTWGQRNTIQNLLNMGFDADESGINSPQGWTVGGITGCVCWSNGFAIIPARWMPVENFNVYRSRQLWSIIAICLSGLLWRSDLQGNLLYKIRVWLDPYGTNQANWPTFVATLTSASTGFSSFATVFASNMTGGGPTAGGSFWKPYLRRRRHSLSLQI